MKSLGHKHIELRDGRILAYREYGDLSGKPLISCHGGLVSGLDIAWADKAAKHAGVRIISPDRPGVGGSSFQQKRQLSDWPNDIEQLLDYLNIEKCTVMGWSMGGQYALVCGDKLSGRVSKILIVAGCLDLSLRKTFVELNPMDKKFSRMSHKLSVFGRIVYRAMWLVARLLPKTWQRSSVKSMSSSDKKIILEEPREYFVEPMVEALGNPKGMLEEYEVFIQPWGFELEDIMIPVAIWQGSEDTLVPAAWAVKMQKNLPHAKLQMIQGAGHFVAHTEITALLSEVVA